MLPQAPWFYSTPPNYIYVHKKGMAFAVPIFIKVLNRIMQRYTPVHPNQTINMANMDTNSFMPLSEAWLSLRCVSRILQSISTFLWTSPNIIQN
jgi:hypothetical protein